MAGDEAEGRVGGRSEQDQVGFTGRSFYSKNNGNIIKGFKHGGDIIKSVFFKNHYGFSMKNILNRARSGGKETN